MCEEDDHRLCSGCNTKRPAPDASEVVAMARLEASACALSGMTATALILKRAADLIERQNAVIEKLPKTADGVRVMAPEKVFTRYGAERFVMGFPGGDVRACENSIEYDPSCPVSDCYSTKEAAEAARDKRCGWCGIPLSTGHVENKCEEARRYEAKQEAAREEAAREGEGE